MKELGAYGDVDLTQLLINEFILGRQGNLSEYHEAVVSIVKEKIGDYYTFSEWSRQKCKDLFISMSFRGKSLRWNDLPQGNIRFKIQFTLLFEQISSITSVPICIEKVLRFLRSS